MSTNRKEHNSEETKRHIKSTFISLYSRKGIDNVTVNELCKECGIVKSTFYTYFDDKYSVLDAIEYDLLEQLAEINPHLDDCDMRDVMSGIPLSKANKTMFFIRDHREEFHAVLGPYGDPSFETRWKKNIENSFFGRFEKEKGNSNSAKIACLIFSSALVAIYKYYIFDVPEFPESDFAIIIGNTLKYALHDFDAFTK